jgi:hypothetical protein
MFAFPRARPCRSRRRPTWHTRLRFEPLEDRALLAITSLIDQNTPVRAIVPSQQQFDDFALAWTGANTAFDDSNWLRSTNVLAKNGVGYDESSAGVYRSYIDGATLDVRASMQNVKRHADGLRAHSVFGGGSDLICANDLKVTL